MSVLLLCALAAGLPALAISAESRAPAVASAAAASPAFKTALPRMELKDGDSMVFLGDSITHQCLYPQYVEDFY
jgi:hypothetical protein